jgi:hypothetical protein
MSELSDFQLELDPNRSTETEPPQHRPPRSPIWIVAAVALAIAGGATYWWLNRQPAAVPETTAETTEAVPPPPPAPTAEPITEPLDMSDAVVRQLVSALSRHPRVAAWLTTDGLIRNFVVVVENISMGMSPAGHLRVLRPTGPFRVVARDEEIVVDPRSYDRYTDIAEAVDSIDPAGAANLYARIKVRAQEAYADLGHTEPFDAALERAIVAMLQVPIVEGTVDLEETGATQYRYVDSRLQQLSGAQKQLLRMGPSHVRTIQAKLRQIGQALGYRIPA